MEINLYKCINKENLSTYFTDTFRWPHEAILLLLSIYKEHEDNMTSGKMSVKKFWNMISCLLIKKGYNITGTQCKSKIDGLKNTYKNVKDHNAKSGNNTRTWRYFNVSRLNIFYTKYYFFIETYNISYNCSFFYVINKHIF